jgi:hypothetical protein
MTFQLTDWLFSGAARQPAMESGGGALYKHLFEGSNSECGSVVASEQQNIRLDAPTLNHGTA